MPIVCVYGRGGERKGGEGKREKISGSNSFYACMATTITLKTSYINMVLYSAVNNVTME